MQIFGVGPLELLMILILALVIMGPQDMVGTARRLGQWVYSVVRSPTWRAIMETSADLRELPTKLVREAGLDEAIKEVKDTADQVQAEMAATTREINAEMQSVSSDVSREMQIAANTVNAEMNSAADDTAAATVAAAAGEAAPALAEGEAAAPAAEAAAVESSPEDILWPVEEATLEESAAQAVPAAPAEAAEPVDPYLSGLDVIARGLGAATGVVPAAEAAVPQMITPDMLARAPQPDAGAALASFESALSAAALTGADGVYAPPQAAADTQESAAEPAPETLPAQAPETPAAQAPETLPAQAVDEPSAQPEPPAPQWAAGMAPGLGGGLYLNSQPAAEEAPAPAVEAAPQPAAQADPPPQESPATAPDESPAQAEPAQEAPSFNPFSGASFDELMQERMARMQQSLDKLDAALPPAGEDTDSSAKPS